MPTTTTNTEDLIAPGEELIPLKIEPDYIYITIPTEYICVYRKLLVLLANYGKQMLIECKASCTERNTKIIECYNMFNAAIAARKLGKDKLADVLIKYIKSQINLIYKDKDDSTSFIFPIDNKGEIQAFVKCGDTPEVYINAEDKEAYEAYMGLISDYEPPEEETAYDVVKNIRELLNKNILRPNLQGITFADGYATDNIADIVVEQRKWIKKIASSNVRIIQKGTFANDSVLEEIDFPNVTNIEDYSFYNCVNLREVDFPNVTQIAQYCFTGCSNLTTINAENVTSIGNSAFANCSSITHINFPNLRSLGVTSFSDCTSLVEASLPNLVQTNTGMFQYCKNLRKLDLSQADNFGNPIMFSQDVNLIDMTIGANIRSNVNFKACEWNPTNAYSDTMNNLVPADVREEHPEWKNKDYLLYCLREHFAANLPDRNGMSPLTITFNGTMKTHINNSSETAAAFTNKNYIIA